MPANCGGLSLRAAALFLPLLALLLPPPSAHAGQHASFGPVLPALPVPDLWAENESGQRLRLRSLLLGRRTALQFVFTNCRLACPMLGSLYQRVQKELAGSPANLITITVDPENDSPARLRQWKQSFHGGPQWQVLRLSRPSLRRLQRLLGQKPGPAPSHTLQIFLIDAQGRYAARTTEMPLASTVADALRTGGQRLAGVAHPAATNPSSASPSAAPSSSSPLGLAGPELYQFAGWQATVAGEPLAGHAARCAGCHTSSSPEAGLKAPPLTAAWLARSHARRGGPPSLYTADTFCESLRSGVDAAGVQFASLMPRYTIDSRSCRTLWFFLTDQPK